MPLLYGWRVNGRIYKRNCELMAVEAAIIKTKVPGAYANQLCVRRQHVHFVRGRLNRAPGS